LALLLAGLLGKVPVGDNANYSVNTHTNTHTHTHTHKHIIVFLPLSVVISKEDITYLVMFVKDYKSLSQKTTYIQFHIKISYFQNFSYINFLKIYLKKLKN